MSEGAGHFSGEPAHRDRIIRRQKYASFPNTRAADRAPLNRCVLPPLVATAKSCSCRVATLTGLRGLESRATHSSSLSHSKRSDELLAGLTGVGERSRDERRDIGDLLVPGRP